MVQTIRFSGTATFEIFPSGKKSPIQPSRPPHEELSFDELLCLVREAAHNGQTERVTELVKQYGHAKELAQHLPYLAGDDMFE